MSVVGFSGSLLSSREGGGGGGGDEVWDRETMFSQLAKQRSFCVVAVWSFGTEIVGETKTQPG